ncbi:homoserine kinase [Actinomyces sp. F1_1611]
MWALGRQVTVEVPATSANLGPGFDSLGLALNWYDRSTVTVIEDGFEIVVHGEGADSVPRDQSHLVVATILEALADWGLQVPGLRFEATNTIPHGRGLGSSSAALVAGLLMAWGLAHPHEEVDRVWLLREAFAREGHADNVAPAIHGGFVITWAGAHNDSPDAGHRSRPSQIHSAVSAVALVPGVEVLTTAARSVLPSEVPFSDAVANASRAALLVHAMSQEPSLFLEATSDRLHQVHRAELMPKSIQLVKELRRAGFGALISGAGPTVLVLLDQDQLPGLRRAIAAADPNQEFTAHELRPGYRARIIHTCE